MKRTFVVALGLVAVLAAAAEAQLTNFPVYSLPSGDPGTFIGAGIGRGLNENSGKFNAFGAMVGRTGVGGRASVAVGAGMVDLDPDAKYSFGGAAAVNVMPAGSAQVAVQAGVGYISFGTDNSVMNFPIGVSLGTEVASGTATIAPWVMPRIHVARVSLLGTSSTESEFGVSGGVAFTTAGGFGLHAAVDMLASDPSALLGGVGVHFMIP